MLDLELITDKFLSNELIENMLEKYGWSCILDTPDFPDLLYVKNEKKQNVFWIHLNKIDLNGNELYDDDLDVEEIMEIKKESRFRDFSPYFNFISYFSDSYSYVVEFLYMLKKEGLRVFFRFNGYKDMKELKNQL